VSITLAVSIVRNAATVSCKRNGSQIGRKRTLNASVITIISSHFLNDSFEIHYISYIACQCHGHSKMCTYNETVDQLSLSMDINNKYQGGGLCHDCQVKKIFILNLIESILKLGVFD
jgi:hypothetical protein